MVARRFLPLTKSALKPVAVSPSSPDGTDSASRGESTTCFGYSGRRSSRRLVAFSAASLCPRAKSQCGLSGTVKRARVTSTAGMMAVAYM